MRLRPRSLFGRTALLIATLAIVSQLLAAALLYVYYDFYYVGTRLRSAAYAVSIQINSLTFALSLLPEREKHWYERNVRSYDILTFPGGLEPPGAPAGHYRERAFEKYLNAQFARTVEVRWDDGRVWVRTPYSQRNFWIGLPRPPVEPEWYWAVAAWLLLGGAIGLVGALWVARRINQPMRALTLAAQQLGRGEAPAQVDATGASEIATLGTAFNQMASNVQRLIGERTLLLAGVSHDLRTPLSRLRLALEMLRKDEDMSLRNGMIQDVDDMDRIIEQFLTYARHSEVEPTRTADLNELIHATTQRYLRDGRDILLDLTQLPVFALRPVAMQRLLTNLIDNAIHHGGGNVEVRTRAHNGSATLSVLDRGPGLPVAPAAPAYRTRLGLMVVERIVQLHRGRLDLLARDGGGLEARVEFPLHQRM